MAASRSLSRLSEILKCSLCKEPYDLACHEPKMLKCQHTFCLTCMQDLVCRNYGNSMFPCPVCGKYVNRPVVTRDLPINQSFVDLLFVKIGQEASDASRVGGETKVGSTVLTKDAGPRHQCLNANDTSSVGGETKVGSTVLTKDAGPRHQCLNANDTNSVGGETKVASTVPKRDARARHKALPAPKCPQHKVKATNVCLQCLQYLCPMCFRLDIPQGITSAHFRHAVEEVELALVGMERDLWQKHFLVKLYLQNKRAELERAIKKSEKLCAAMEAKVHERCEEMKRQAKEWERGMKAKIKAVETEHCKVADSKILVMKYEEALCTSLWRNGQEKIKAKDLQIVKVMQVFDDLKRACSGDVPQCIDKSKCRV